MPVTKHDFLQEKLYQREQYSKGGLGRLHWDYRDKVSLSLIRPNDLTLLDLGCGEGVTLEKMVRKFPEREVLGIDILKENVEIGKNLGLRIEYGDVYQLGLPDQSVDYILFSEVIEHLQEPDKALAEIHRVLKPLGRVVIVFPNDTVFKIARLATFRFREAAYDPGHVKQWKPTLIKKYLAASGFKVVFSRNIPFCFWPICLHGIVAVEKPFPSVNGG